MHWCPSICPTELHRQLDETSLRAATRNRPSKIPGYTGDSPGVLNTDPSVLKVAWDGDSLLYLPPIQVIAHELEEEWRPATTHVWYFKKL